MSNSGSGSWAMQQRELVEAQGADWERNDFPVVCTPCLGDNPYIRMTKATFDKECKICQRPFTVFRWRNGNFSGYKQTQVCQTCAKLKNCCQSCILDLEFGLPTNVRDAGLAIPGLKEVIPINPANREWMQNQAEKKMAAGESKWGRHGVETVVQSLMRMQPYYERNRAHVCAFWLRGQCDKGTSCPYLHEKPEEMIKSLPASALSPAAAADADGPPLPPADVAITTLFLGGVDPKKMTENDLRVKLEAYGALRSVRCVPRKLCAFVEFEQREDAERAMTMLFGRFQVSGCFISLAWSFKANSGLSSTTTPSATTAAASATARQAFVSSISSSSSSAPPPPPPGSAPVEYPSMSAAQKGVSRKQTVNET